MDDILRMGVEDTTVFGKLMDENESFKFPSRNHGKYLGDALALGLFSNELAQPEYFMCKLSIILSCC